MDILHVVIYQCLISLRVLTIVCSFLYEWTVSFNSLVLILLLCFFFKHNQNGSSRLWFYQTFLICCLSPALRVPLLVRHPDTKELVVNFDPLIYEVIKESECMRKLHLDIPEFAKTLCLLRKKLKADHCTLKVSFILGQTV